MFIICLTICIALLYLSVLHRYIYLYVITIFICMLGTFVLFVCLSFFSLPAFLSLITCTLNYDQVSFCKMHVKL